MDERAALGERGQAVWDAYDAPGLPAGHRALVHEAARICDTLDKLSRLAAGDVATWATVIISEVGEVTLEIGPILAEMRNQQTTLKNVLMEIRQVGLVQKKPRATRDEEPEDDDVIVSFQRAAARRAAGL
jgi:hypothetical protein